MLSKYFVRFLLVFLVKECVSEVGPHNVPTKGAVWPKPREQTKGTGVFVFDPEKFEVALVGHNCTILANRIRHYIYRVKEMNKLVEKYKDTSLDSNSRQKQEHMVLQVDLDKPCESYPHLYMDETYNLTVLSATNVTLHSSSVWGIIRGLETFSQLFYFTDDFQEIHIDSTTIHDYPEYHHRGLLLDTSRHFIPLDDILLTIEALAMNKMNVFHWHIVDDQSFPYQSEKYPDLSVQGAYHRSMVYSKADIQTVISYATERGVRVIPEFDVPGHTQSWGAAYPNLLTQCWKNGMQSGLGPMDPTKNTTYKFVKGLLEEVKGLFPEHFVHIGGDEVDMTCWNSNPEVSQWMRDHNMTAHDLQTYFLSNIVGYLREQPRSDAIMWQEAFQENTSLPKSTIFQVWKNWGSPAWVMFDILRAGFPVLYSSEWYLDHLGQTFEVMLQVDPRGLVGRRATVDLDKLLGGEACMWAEKVDDTNLHSRVWPRAYAVAERLWSGPTERSAVAPETLRRAEEHACRMRRRGVPCAPPTGPGYCLH